nr:nucleotidyltransferase domain-containing protein [Anaerolineae bacterium]
MRRLLEAVGKEYRLEKAILFGSRARGDHLKHSDVDLLLVSDDFTGIPFPDRPSKLYRYWEGGLPLEMLCYTVSEFGKKKKMIGLVQDAVQEGISLI